MVLRLEPAAWQGLHRATPALEQAAWPPYRPGSTAPAQPALDAVRCATV